MVKKISGLLLFVCFAHGSEVELTDLFKEIDTWATQYNLLGNLDMRYIEGPKIAEGVLVKNPNTQDNVEKEIIKIKRIFLIIFQKVEKVLQKLATEEYDNDLHFFTRRFIAKEVQKLKILNNRVLNSKEGFEVIFGEIKNLYSNAYILEHKFKEENYTKIVLDEFTKDSYSPDTLYSYLLIWAVKFKGIIEEREVLTDFPFKTQVSIKSNKLVTIIKEKILHDVGFLLSITDNQNIKNDMEVQKKSIEQIDVKELTFQKITIIKKVYDNIKRLEKSVINDYEVLQKDFVSWGQEHGLLKTEEKTSKLTSLSNNLEQNNFKKIMSDVKNALIKKFDALKKYDNVLFAMYQVHYVHLYEINTGKSLIAWKNIISEIKKGYGLYQELVKKILKIYCSWAIDNALLQEDECKNKTIDQIINIIKHEIVQRVNRDLLSSLPMQQLLSDIQKSNNLTTISAIYSDYLKLKKNMKESSVKEKNKSDTSSQSTSDESSEEQIETPEWSWWPWNWSWESLEALSGYRFKKQEL